MKKLGLTIGYFSAPAMKKLGLTIGYFSALAMEKSGLTIGYFSAPASKKSRLNIVIFYSSLLCTKGRHHHSLLTYQSMVLLMASSKVCEGFHPRALALSLFSE